MNRTLKTNIVCSLSALFFFCGCKDHVTISFSCEQDKKNNYILKWEVFPEKDNAKINIFASNNDSLFPKDPTETRSVNEYIAIIEPSSPFTREFFKLKVGKVQSGVISNRYFPMDSIQNFRDVGGYYTRTGSQMRWGKIYRSGSLNRLSENDMDILKGLGIKTVVDFRNLFQVNKHPDVFSASNNLHIPINANAFTPEIKQRILEGAFLKGDAIIYTQDSYRDIIENYAAQMSQFFDILCDESNYPIVYHCGLGKDRTGLASFFLLKALDIHNDFIEEDFLLSNEGIDKLKLIREGHQLPEPMQEAMTTIAKADISQLRYAITCMKKKSGSVDEYMTEELKLTPQKRQQLRKILLY